MPVFGFSTARPFAVLPLAGLQPRERVCDETCAAPVAAAPPAEVDAEMQKRREINAIREQMRIAAENEDFEKAAELRDKIKKME
jgi:excinuclease UvrABC helicase subunit UvrB